MTNPITQKAHDDALAALKAEHTTAIETLKSDHTKALEKAVADLKADLEKAKMSDDEKEHCADMDEEKKKKFLAKSAADRKAEIALAKGADESITVGSTVIRKSKVGAEVFAAMKAQDDARKASEERVAKAEEAAQMAKLEKRADDEFKNLPGTTLEKAQALKAVAAAPEAVRTHLEKMLAAGEAAIAKSFTRMGASGGPDPSIKKGQDDFNAAVSKIQKRDECTKSEALGKAAIEHPDLYEAYQEAGRSIQAAA